MSGDVIRYTMCMNSAASHSDEDGRYEWIYSGGLVVRASDYDKLAAEKLALEEKLNASTQVHCLLNVELQEVRGELEVEQLHIKHLNEQTQSHREEISRLRGELDLAYERAAKVEKWFWEFPLDGSLAVLKKDSSAIGSRLETAALSEIQMQECAREAIRLLEQKNQALEEVIAGLRKPEIF